MPDVVPLPEALNDCGCPHATRGQHLTSCVPAREYRPDYVEGVRYQAVSWEYPLRLSIRVDVDLRIDPVQFIVEHRKAYDAFDLDGSYQEWEKPMMFLSSLIDDDLGAIGGWFGHPRHVSTVTADVTDVDEMPTWTPADTERVHEALGSVPVSDPNQGALGFPKATE